MARRRALTGGLIATVIAAAAIAALPADGASGPVTLSFLDVSVRATPVLAAAEGEPRPGDRLFLADALYTWHGGRRGQRAGSTTATLTFMSPFGKRGATADLTGQVFLRGGSIRTAGVVQLREGPSHFVLPIVGGTGRYAGARGTIESRDLDSSGKRSALIVHLIS